MTNAQRIIDIYDQYDNTERIVILGNLNIAIAIGKSKGMPVDRYVALPQLTNRSKFTVMQWFQREWIKIPLRDLGIIAEYLGYNIYTFFMDLDDNTAEEFLAHDAICNEKYGTDCTKLLNKAIRLHAETPKDNVLDNLELYWKSGRHYSGTRSYKRFEDVTECTGCKRDIYYTWFSRSKVKATIPLVSLCKISEFTGMDIFFILENVVEKEEETTIS